MSPLVLGAWPVAALFVALWAVSVRARDASLVDRVWGPAFALSAWLQLALAPDAGPRAWLVAVLTTVWGVRLGLHIHRRNRGHAEDPRYAAMRARAPRTFPLTSLVTVFLLQAALVVVIGLPFASLAASRTPLGLLDALALMVWLVGFLFEVVGDAQLAAFKRDPANRGRIMDRGLWAWTRHPNYFGDACVWWGVALFALAARAPWWTLAGPGLMTFLLTRVSGVAMLEAGMRGRPGWDAYAARTSAFLPRPPRR